MKMEWLYTLFFMFLVKILLPQHCFFVKCVITYVIFVIVVIKNKNRFWKNAAKLKIVWEGMKLQ